MNYLNWRKLFRVACALFFIPCLSGAIAGICLDLYTRNSDQEDFNHYETEVSRAQWLDSFSVPGQPFHDTNLPPFYVPQLRTTNWLQKLQLNKPPAEVGVPTTKATLASFDDVYVLKSQLRHHWIYVSFFPAPEIDPWDKAFDELVQYHAHFPPAHNATLNFVKCISTPMLCKLWEVTPPALVYVSPVPDKCRSNPYAEFSQPLFGEEATISCPVEARIIHLPLQANIELKRFPSYFQQMLNLTQDDSLHSAFPLFNFNESLNNRWKTHMRQLTAKWLPLQLIFKGSNKFKALPPPLGPICDLMESLAFVLSDLLFGISYILVKFAFNQIAAFLGGSSTPPASSPPMPTPSQNLMKSMLSGFVESLKKNMSEEEHAQFVELLQNFTSNYTMSAL